MSFRKALSDELNRRNATLPSEQRAYIEVIFDCVDRIVEGGPGVAYCWADIETYAGSVKHRLLKEKKP